MTKKERRRLQRLLADTDLSELAEKLAGFMEALKASGFKRDEAFALVLTFHDYLCNSTFERPEWDKDA